MDDLEFSLFPPEICESEILYIIGNGFDIAHNIKSKYSDFQKWCCDNKLNISIFDALFSTRQDFWKDIETALGSYDEEAILEFCKPDEEFDYEHPLSSSAKVEDAPMNILKPALDDLRIWFVKWVNSIDISSAKPYLHLHKDAKYFTFNYTETLENVYIIPFDNICHIHGNRLLHDNQYIFGHNNLKKDNGKYGERPLFEENAYLSIVECFNEFIKPIKEKIGSNKLFFESLSDIKFVYVLGHSLSAIDIDYFKEIFFQFKQQPRFIFSTHDKKDEKMVIDFVVNNKIRQYKIIDITDLELK